MRLPGQERVGAPDEDGCRAFGAAEDLAGGVGAVDQEEEAISELLWMSGLDGRCPSEQAAAHFDSIGDSDLVSGMRTVGKLRGVVDERTAAVGGGRGTFGNEGHKCAQLAARVGVVPGKMLVHVCPIVCVDLFEISDDQIVLGIESAIEADFGDAGLFDDRLDADGADALIAEQVGGDFKDSIASTFFCWRLGAAAAWCDLPGFLQRIGSFSTDCKRSI